MPRRLTATTRVQRKKPGPNTLESRMLLHRFMCDQFGFQGLQEMLRHLANFPQESPGSAVSRFAEALSVHIGPAERTQATQEDLARYHNNIVQHSHHLGIADASGKSWKPFQYLALLFAERYLDLYFHSTEQLAQRLNEWKSENGQPLNDMDDYAPEDLHTLAFQSATGSGKTLLLHANILQYRHYMRQCQRLHKLNKIILVTPDEGLSRQHLRALRTSNIPAQLFSDHSEGDIFSRGGFVVDIIDLHKLDEKKGVKRVALDSFEENNLVMVDEGHLGTGGRVWRKRRKQLAKNGFTFEYSATFSQAVAGGGDEIKTLRNEYGKAILFDYSYRLFYEDGYGKDYRISNLQKSDDGEANNIYLLACLLMFYQQCLIYANKRGQWRDFNIAPPLWVFLGKTVTGGQSAAKTATETDVVRIVKFLAWVQKDRERVVADIDRLFGGQSGLIDKEGADIFAHSFSFIADKKASDLYKDLCVRIFRGSGQLCVAHLTGSDELHLRIGDKKPFGVINVGDAAGLHARLGAVEGPWFALSKDTFSQPLFDNVDHHDSPINIVVGARKFAAGWNSWRVSTMGLMHVGVGEGPQIIQMFGRGIRLKGHNMSLKRHTALKEVSPSDSTQLKLLETLNIFGLKANYMDKFKEYLQEEGVKTEQAVFTLRTNKQFREVKYLKTIRKQAGAAEFLHSKERIKLSAESDLPRPVGLECYGRLEWIRSSGDSSEGAQHIRQDQRFNETHLTLMNARTIYEQVLRRKQSSSWHNMEISRETVDSLLDPKNQGWYALHISPEKLALSASSTYARVRQWEELATDLIAEYAEEYWLKRRNTWEHKHMKVAELGDDDQNYFEEYQLSVDEKEKGLILDIKRFLEELEQEQHTPEFKKLFPLGKIRMSLLNPSFHAYCPLLYSSSDSKDQVQVSPVALNDGEAKFVEHLHNVVCRKDNETKSFRDKDIYLMRNLSRGRGLSFFNDYFFYPDFILWLIDSRSNRQHILFIDPKGLVHYDDRTRSKVELHKRIKCTEKRMQKTHPELFLSAYIWSQTDAKDIGSNRRKSEKQWNEEGVFFGKGKVPELERMLEHALGSEHVGRQSDAGCR